MLEKVRFACAALALLTTGVIFTAGATKKVFAALLPNVIAVAHWEEPAVHVPLAIVVAPPGALSTLVPSARTVSEGWTVIATAEYCDRAGGTSFVRGAWDQPST